MEIEHLVKLADNPILRGDQNIGLTTEEIDALESKLDDGLKFPAVWREYLYLCGDSTQIQLDMPYKDFAAMQDEFHRILALSNVELSRPVYVIDSLLGFDGGTFFYLDEESDNPEVWYCRPYFERGTFEDTLKKARPPKLLDYLNHLLDLAIAGKTL